MKRRTIILNATVALVATLLLCEKFESSFAKEEEKPLAPNRDLDEDERYTYHAWERIDEAKIKRILLKMNLGKEKKVLKSWLKIRSCWSSFV